MSESTGTHDHATQLRTAAQEYQAATAAVEEHGKQALEDAREAYETAVSLLRQFEDKATGTGAEEFVRTAQIRGGFGNHVEELDENLPGRDAFEAAADAIDKRRLSSSHFDRAREHLQPVETLVERLDRYETAREELKDARIDARERLETIETRIEALERLLELGDIEGNVALDPLRDPIDTYNESVRAGVAELRTDGSARELFALIDRAQAYPLVEFDQPPEELRTFVESDSAGEESVTQLLEYADYSRSKLSHYVDDADRLKRRVATQRTYLERLDAEPLTIGWPPPPADELPWRTRALRAVANPVLDENAVAALRELERLAREEERYDRLRTAASADAQLTAEDRERLDAGEVDRDLDRRRDEREAIETALEETPEIQ